MYMYAFGLIYLSLPLFIFFIGFLKPVFSISFSVILGLVLLKLFNSKDFVFKISRKAVVLIFIFSFIIVLIAGIGDIYFASTSDWLKHYLVIRDLMFFKWPVEYGVSYLLPDTTLTYYIGYYLVPALIGKVGFNWEIVRLSVYFYTVFGVFIGLSIIWIILKNKKFVSMVVFLLFGGLDVLGYFLVHGFFQKIGLHFEGWTEAKMQFSSMFTLLSWVPQHFIPGLIIVPLLFNEITHKNRLDTIVAYISLTALWSVFTCFGLILFIPISIFITLRKKGIRNVINQINVLSMMSIILLSVFFLYYKTNVYSGSGENGFIWEYIKGWKSYWGLFLFYLLEVNIAFPLLLYIKKIDRSKRTVIIWIIIIVNVIPIYKVGLMNDFVMRVSIPALIMINLLIASYFSKIQKNKLLYVFVIIVLFIGSLTQFNEIYTSITSKKYKYTMPEKNINELTVQKNAPIIGSQYFGSRSRLFFRVFAK